MKCEKCDTELKWNCQTYRYEDCSNCGNCLYDKCDTCGEILVNFYEEYSYKDCPKCRLHKDETMLSKQEALEYARKTMVCYTCKYMGNRINDGMLIITCKEPKNQGCVLGILYPRDKNFGCVFWEPK